MTTFQIERGSGVAAWRQIETWLRERIARGALKPGQRIETETRLAEQFGVNRHTVRRALAALAEDGLLSIEQGRGTFVRDMVIDYPIGSRTRFSEIVAAQDHEPKGTLLGIETMPAPPEVGVHLELARGALVSQLDTLGFSDEVPISTSTHWFPAALFPGIGEVYPRFGSITATLAHFGIEDYSRVWTGLSARMPSREDADLLSQAPNRPVLIAEAVNADPAGRLIQFSRTRFAGERVQVMLRNQA